MRDAVIVLANLMDAEGHLNEESLSRLSLGCELVRTGEAAILVTCGWAYRNDSDIRIADAMAEHAVHHMKIERSRIIAETNSRDTVGDAVFTKLNISNKYGWNNIIVSTSSYHVERTREIFSFVYGRDIAVAGSDDRNDAALTRSEAESISAFRSTFKGISPGDDRAIYERLKTEHPFYNGRIHPKLS